MGKREPYPLLERDQTYDWNMYTKWHRAITVPPVTPLSGNVFQFGGQSVGAFHRPLFACRRVAARSNPGAEMMQSAADGASV